jgi:hypothetical protein
LPDPCGVRLRKRMPFQPVNGISELPSQEHSRCSVPGRTHRIDDFKAPWIASGAVSSSHLYLSCQPSLDVFLDLAVHNSSVAKRAPDRTTDYRGHQKTLTAPFRSSGERFQRVDELSHLRRALGVKSQKSSKTVSSSAVMQVPKSVLGRVPASHPMNRAHCTRSIVRQQKPHGLHSQELFAGSSSFSESARPVRECPDPSPSTLSQLKSPFSLSYTQRNGPDIITSQSVAILINQRQTEPK